MRPGCIPWPLGLLELSAGSAVRSAQKAPRRRRYQNAGLTSAAWGAGRIGARRGPNSAPAMLVPWLSGLRQALP